MALPDLSIAIWNKLDTLNAHARKIGLPGSVVYDYVEGHAEPRIAYQHPGTPKRPVVVADLGAPSASARMLRVNLEALSLAYLFTQIPGVRPVVIRAAAKGYAHGWIIIRREDSKCIVLRCEPGERLLSDETGGGEVRLLTGKVGRRQIDRLASDDPAWTWMSEPKARSLLASLRADDRARRDEDDWR